MASVHYLYFFSFSNPNALLERTFVQQIYFSAFPARYCLHFLLINAQQSIRR
jgi:hypothetical protein